jgi:hypothetical protein
MAVSSALGVARLLVARAPAALFPEGAVRELCAYAFGWLGTVSFSVRVSALVRFAHQQRARCLTEPAMHSSI